MTILTKEQIKTFKNFYEGQTKDRAFLIYQLSQTALTLHEKLEKAEAELAELREECCDIAGNLCNELIKRINNNEPFDAMEMASVVQSRIRKLTGGEDE